MFEKIVSVFKVRNITVLLSKSRVDAVQKILKLIPIGSSIGYGGSVTLEQLGILDQFRKGDYVFYDRSKVTPFTKKSHDLAHLAQHADYFLSSANAITLDGKIVNVDRTGNRVSSLIYGPEHVIIVAGKNKIVKNLDEAIHRIRTIAAPLNARQKQANTPCVKTGVCQDCLSPDRLCNNWVIIEKQHLKGRMTLIIVDEELGY